MTPQGDDDAVQAKFLIAATAQLKEGGYDVVEFQTVLGQAGSSFVIPAALQRDGTVWLVYSHTGKWQNGDITRFMAWNQRVRQTPETAGAPILVVYDDPPVALISNVGERNGVFFHLYSQAQ